jgi:hypothetical protein
LTKTGAFLAAPKHSDGGSLQPFPIALVADFRAVLENLKMKRVE